MLTDEERRLMAAWNDTQRDFPRDIGFHELFERQADRAPDSVAVEFEDQRLTYGELNARANQLAHRLRELGVGPETLVGLCLERSMDVVTGILGILKAGGAYLPLAADYPRQRLEFMLDEAQVACLVTHDHLRDRLPAIAGVVVCLDTERAALEARPATNSRVEVQANNLAYVMYTSGSTGKPKGVEISHGNVANLLTTIQSIVRIGPSCRVLGIAPATFDISVSEMFLPLTAGGTTIVVGEETAKDPRRLIETIATSRPTIVDATPATWLSLVQSGWSEGHGVTSISSGEELPRPLAAQLLEICDVSWNFYGPTETTIWSTTRLLQRDSVDNFIGRPIANTQVYVLDDRMEPMPIGIPGELYIGGDGLARGYLNRPGLTAERFVDNPFSDDPGSRLYRTGDLCRWRADGNLEFVGRVDHQVKLRGFRIELGEIEAALNDHPSIVHCVVVLRTDHADDRRLVAYCVCADDTPMNVAELRSHLQDRLPDYMVPAAFVPLAALPLTSNGKLDRRALPEPSPSRAGLGAVVPPTSSTETALAAIWTALLGVDEVGVNDSFFDLGGHSLLAMRLASRVRDALGMELRVQSVFESPRLADLATRIDEDVRAGSGVTSQPIAVAPRNRPLPVSAVQERMWFASEYEPHSPVYNVAWKLEVHRGLDAAALNRAVGAIVHRHEALRTNFDVVDGQAMQRIHAESDVAVRVEDLAGLPAESSHARLEELVQEQARRPFDLRREPLVRFTLIRLPEDENVLLLVMHHIISDGWSLGIIFDELTTLHDAFRAGTSATLAELPVQCADYACWQREGMRGRLLDDQLAYWRNRLAAPYPTVDLPTDFPRPPVQSFRGARESRLLGPECGGRLGRVARSEGATLSMALLAGFQALLHRYSRQDDIVVASPVAGRPRSEVEGLIGCFVNTVVIRTDLAGSPSFRQLLGRVRDAALGAYTNQDVPFDKLVEHLNPVRDASRSPLFQIMFAFQDIPRPAQKHGLCFTATELDTGTSKFDLMLFVEPGPDGLVATVEYNVDLFERSTIRRMLGHLQMLLDGAVSEPDRAVDDLPLLSEGEKRQLLVDWNDTGRDYPQDPCLHGLVERQAAQSPDAVAVECEGRRLTYRELNEQSNRLAHRLLELGVGPDALVGICVDRGTDLPVGILGILKAGGAYVPLDSEYPRQRLEFMLKEAQVACLVAHGHLRDRLPEVDARTVCLDEDAEALASCPNTNPSTDVRGDSLAYVMYTSGSTGRPKGVQIPHRCIVNLFSHIHSELRIDASCRLLGIAPTTFDISVAEMFLPLVVGGTTVVVGADTARDPRELAETIATSRPSIVQATPSTWASLLQCDWHAHGGLALISTGEELLRPLARHLRQTCAELWDFYGPTETNVCTTRQVPREAVNSSIGRPIANTRIYVLDDRRQPVPIGVPGELYVGGAGLARGYLNRPELTSEKFVANPFSDDPDSRLYRTGDLCRWQADGGIEFLGRIDDQVKLRGFRIELGEIEAVLNEHPSVVLGAVKLCAPDAGDKRLVAYCVCADDRPMDVAQLRRHLHERVPDYMVPAAFVAMTALPLTSSGKVDRRALPEPKPSREGLDAYVGATTPTEASLAAIWSEILGVEKIGIHDNFFELGGHSLMAVRLASRLRDAMGVDLRIRSVFQTPRLADLAAGLDALAQAGSVADPSPIVVVARDRPLPLSFAQERMWFASEYEPQSPLYNIAWKLRITRGPDVPALSRAVRELVRRHEVLRTNFDVVDGQAMQRIHPQSEIDLDIADLSGLSAESSTARFEELLDEHRQRAFDLRREPLVRFTLVQLPGNESVLLLVMHHIVSDGWSMDIVFDELTALHDAFRAGASATLAELPVQYADYAAWRRQAAQGKALDDQLAYWRDRLSAPYPTVDLATDFPRPPVQTYRGSRESVDIDHELDDRLGRLARDEGATLSMVLLAAFQALLHRYTGQDDIVVASPVAGRTRSEIEGLIGCFVNTVVLRTDFSGTPSFRRLLDRVRKAALGAYANQDLPFEKLVEHFHTARDRSRSPLFQIMFAFQDVQRPPPGDGLRFSATELETGTSKFDLTLFIEPRPEGLAATFEYNIDLFERQTIRRMLAHWQSLLEGIIAEPDRPVDELRLLTAGEQRRLLVEWNDTQRDYPRDASIHELFEQQARRTPDAVAVEFEDRRLTYGELNERSNQLAHCLRESGVGPEAVVGICALRGLDLPVGILGILKSGGAYLPLDPDHPRQRLEFTLHDARADHLVTQRDLLDRLPAKGRRVLCLDGDPTELQSRPRTDPGAAVGGRGLAYVMYTSGSTGKPKGVEIEHGSVVRLVQGAGYATFGDDRVFLQLAPIAFDASTFELWGALLHGARLVMAPHGMPDFSALERLVKDRGVTTLWLTASLFNQIVTQRPAALETLSEVLTGGEALSVPHVRLAQERLPGLTLVNGYGPTETTTFATCFRIPPAVPETLASIPIGRPIANTQVYVLDGRRRPVPIGIPGELYIGGAGLARGYVDRPELTAETFVANPFEDDLESRLYRTGDRCRWLADGNLEFLGRFDQQVKLRGFRIEPGEIEAALNDHPSVVHSVVTLHGDRATDKRLVAYGVCANGATWDIAELRRHLRARLPEHMIPAAFVALPALPLTSSGKVDRLALPAPTDARPEPGEAGDAPRDSLEESLARIWRDVLGVERVGVHDDFFALGGHSLMATRLFAEIERDLGARLPLVTLFEGSTIHELGEIIRCRPPEAPRCSVVSIREDGIGLPVYVFPGIGGQLFANRVLIDILAEQSPVRGLCIREQDRRAAPFRRIEDMASQFVANLLQTQPTGPYIFVGYSFGGTVAYETARQLEEQGAEIALLAIIDAEPGIARRDSGFRRVASILRNLPFWMWDDCMKETPQAMWARATRKLKEIRRRTSRFAAPGTERGDELEIQDIVDTRDVPPYFRDLMQGHLGALQDYVAKPCAGRITLFRARGRPLLYSCLPDLGWGRVARGGVEAHSIPCGHERILREPYVSMIGDRLRESLATVNRAHEA